MTLRKWICALLFVAASALPSLSFAHHRPGVVHPLIADGGAPPPPPIPYGSAYSA